MDSKKLAASGDFARFVEHVSIAALLRLAAANVDCRRSIDLHSKSVRSVELHFDSETQVVVAKKTDLAGTVELAVYAHDAVLNDGVLATRRLLFTTMPEAVLALVPQAALSVTREFVCYNASPSVLRFLHPKLAFVQLDNHDHAPAHLSLRAVLRELRAVHDLVLAPSIFTDADQWLEIVLDWIGCSSLEHLSLSMHHAQGVQFVRRSTRALPDLLNAHSLLRSLNFWTDVAENSRDAHLIQQIVLNRLRPPHFETSLVHGGDSGCFKVLVPEQHKHVFVSFFNIPSPQALEYRVS